MVHRVDFNTSRIGEAGKVSDVPIGVFFRVESIQVLMQPYLQKMALMLWRPFLLVTTRTMFRIKTNSSMLGKFEVINARHHEILLKEKTLRLLPQMVALQDEPIADPVCVPLYHGQTSARCGNRVCQVGEGADELYWGIRTGSLL